MSKDVLLGQIRNPQLLKACLDVVVQSLRPTTQRLKLVEYAASSSCLFVDVLPLMKIQPGITLEYTALDPNPKQLDASLTEAHGVVTQEGDLHKCSEMND